MEFKVGYKINHEKYGNGIIIGISKLEIVGESHE